MKIQHWLLDTKWACAGIVSVDGMVTETAPIFRRFLGLRIENLKRIYKVQPVFSPEIENQKQFTMVTKSKKLRPSNSLLTKGV